MKNPAKLYKALGELEATWAAQYLVRECAVQGLHSARRAFYDGARASGGDDLVQLVFAWAHAEWALGQALNGVSETGASRARKLFVWAARLARRKAPRAAPWVSLGRAKFELSLNRHDVARRAAARAALQKMATEHCPRPHYCIYCGSEGPVASKCAPCGFYRGTFCFPPKGGDTLMGRKLAFVSWPWQGDPDAPYVRAGAAADAAPEPKSKYAVDPPPVRAMTRDEVFGPNPCAEGCPKYPNSTAARLVAYVLGKVDHVTQGVQSDFRYCLRTNEDWRKTRERIIEIHEAGEENAAEVLHEEYLVGHHKVCETEENRPAYLPADWDGMKRRVKARQKKDRGPGALAYPDSDADEDDVAAYLEAKIAALDCGA